jgi:hypothetical protein
MPTTEQPFIVPLFQWVSYCQDTKALQERGLGVANCLVCGQEPRDVVVKECLACLGAHGGRDVLGHVAWLGCGHQAEVEFTGSELDRAVMYGVQP